MWGEWKVEICFVGECVGGLYVIVKFWLFGDELIYVIMLGFEVKVF